jgi:cell wall-associated NlpC family hydrolase
LRAGVPALLALFVALISALTVAVLVAPPALSATYSQVVDNSSTRFRAPDWGKSSYSKEQMYGTNYRYTKPSKEKGPAKFKVKRPSAGYYTIYARWPANSGYNGAARIKISAASGVKVRVVDQRKNGGRWVKLGTFKMTGGDGYAIRVAARSDKAGYVIADAVKIVKGSSSSSDSDEVNGYDVVREAKNWLGVPYKYGGTSKDGVDCSGLTMKVYEKLGIKLPRTAYDQYHSGPGTKVSKDSLKRGFLIFGHADGGSGIQHTGILTGDGRMIHAPQPGTVVRYDDVPAGWYNIVGVKKIVPAS